MNAKYLGEQIRSHRIRLGLTQDDLAEICGYKSKQSISRIETGANFPSYDAMKKIADALDVPVAILMGIDGTEDLKKDVYKDLYEYLEPLSKASDEKISVIRNLLGMKKKK